MNNARSYICLFCLFLALDGAAQSLTDTLEQWYAEAKAYTARPFPQETTMIKNDPRLDDMSPGAIAHRAEFWQSFQQKLARVDAADLQDQDLINFEVFRYIVNDNADGYKYKTYLLPFDAEGGFHTSFGFIPRSASFNTKADYEKYLVKLEGFGQYVDQHIALMKQGIHEGYVMPCVIVGGFDETARAYLTAVEESLFYEPFLAIPGTIADADAIIARGKKAVEESILAGYRRLAEFLQDEYIPACSQAIGAAALPNGIAYYEQRVRYFTTLEMTAQEIFAIGQNEVARIRAEMEAIIDSLDFEGTFADFLDYLRSDPRFYAKTPHELLAEASYFSKKIDGKLPQYFGKLPRLPYGVAPVPDQIAPRYTGGRYVPGSYSQHRAGTYWVNTYNLNSRPLYVLPSLTLHEAVPGHHLQISLAAEAQAEGGDTLPDFRNSYYISAFGEGWALYTEWLGKEMGIYEDLYQQFGALTYEMWRACRLVVDPGMHAMGWTRDQAVNFMAENTALSLHEINTEINRYIGWPGQAVSYKIGELKIRELRKEAEVRLGERFDLRAFHDTILKNGSIPLFVLERVVRDWIGKELTGQSGDK